MELNLQDWPGGEMPVPLGTPVIVVHRDGEVHACSAGGAYANDWTHTNDDGDILAFLAIRAVSA